MRPHRMGVGDLTRVLGALKPNYVAGFYAMERVLVQSDERYAVWYWPLLTNGMACVLHNSSASELQHRSELK